MNEDDTFKALSRPQIREMMKLYEQWDKDRNYAYPTSERIDFMKSHRWSWIEFLRERMQVSAKH